MKYNTLFTITILFLFLTIISGCGERTAPRESKIDLTVDVAVWDLMKTPLKMFDTTVTDVKLNRKEANSMECVAQLLSGEAQTIILSRDLSKREDSIIKANGMQRPERQPLAQDGLVFFVNESFPLDTLSDEILKAVLTDEKKNLRTFFPQLKDEPQFCVADRFSSEYFNLDLFILKGKQPFTNVKLFANTDSVMNYVDKNPNAIGIAYLSHVFDYTKYKLLKISFIDTAGRYVKPLTVDQAYIIQNLYPYKITHWIYILDTKNYLPPKLAGFLRAPQGKVQPYFLSCGIVPAVGDIRLLNY
jgi:ABC-type phosphate transport system substrate-binding protein